MQALRRLTFARQAVRRYAAAAEGKTPYKRPNQLEQSLCVLAAWCKDQLALRIFVFAAGYFVAGQFFAVRWTITKDEDAAPVVDETVIKAKKLQSQSRRREVKGAQAE